MNILVRTVSASVLGLAALPACAAAQVAPSAPEAQVEPAPAVAAADPVAAAGPAEGYVRLPANTPVTLQIVGTLGSKISKIDETFQIRLRYPIMVDNKIIVPAGILGQGEVVHAARARAMGKAGELILAARYLSCGATQIKLRGFRLDAGDTGRDKIDQVAVLTIAVATPFMFMSGGDLVVPPGSLGQARLTSAVDVRVDSDPTCVAPAPEPAAAVVPVAASGPVISTTPAVATAPAQSEGATATPANVPAK